MVTGARGATAPKDASPPAEVDAAVGEVLP